MSEQESEATQNMDESQVQDFDFDALADDVLGLEPEAATQENEEATEELTDDDPIVDEDADEVGEVEEDDTEEEVEDEDESTDATQDNDTEEAEDYEIDMDFAVPVKIDGEDSTVTMEELVANYQTKQSQSKKGDELAEQAKQLEDSRSKATLFADINVRLLQNEDEKDLRILQGLKDKVDLAYDEDDFDAGKLNRQLEKAKEEYSGRKSKRDSLLSTMGQEFQEQRDKDFAGQVEHFNSNIKTHIPDWSEGVAASNREFALSLGLNAQLVDSITDPVVVSIIDGYRRLKATSSKGAVKRQKAPVKRAPTKKPITAKNKKTNKIDQSRQRVAKGKGTSQDEHLLFNDAIDNLFE